MYYILSRRAFHATPLPSFCLFIAASLCFTGCGVINGVVGDISDEDPAQDMSSTSGMDMDNLPIDMGVDPCQACDGLCLAVHNEKRTTIEIKAPSKKICVAGSSVSTSKEKITYSRDRTIMAHDPNDGYIYIATPQSKAQGQEQTIDLHRVALFDGKTLKKTSVSLGSRTENTTDAHLQALHPLTTDDPEVLLVSQVTLDASSKVLIHEVSSDLANTAPIDHDASLVPASAESYSLVERKTPGTRATRFATALIDDDLLVSGQYCGDSGSDCPLMSFHFPFPQQGNGRVKLDEETTPYTKTRAIDLNTEDARLYASLSLNPTSLNQSRVTGFLLDDLGATLESTVFDLNNPTLKFNVCPSALHYFNGYATSPQHVLLNTKTIGNNRIGYEAISMLTLPDTSTIKYLAWQSFQQSDHLSCLEFDANLTSPRLLDTQYEDRGSGNNGVYTMALKATASPPAPDTLVLVRTDNLKDQGDINYYTIGVTDAQDSTGHKILHAFIDQEELVVVTSTSEASERPIHLFKLSLESDFPY